ncbi:MAG TPA: hypothetical protein VLJ68_08625 [Chitinophagaceae bacterium]|nr:hypothetical protein [Chitinophagaceae bacterium]
MSKISSSFLIYASDILADTEAGISGGLIVKIFNAKSVEYGIDIPHSKIPFKDVPNKRTAFLQNLEKFSPEQQFEIIEEILEESKFSDNVNAKQLKTRLFSQYKSLSKKETIVESDLVIETKHWLQKFSDSYKLFLSAIEKYEKKIYERNLLDDMRLSLELLLQQILKNNKSLENQIADVSSYQKMKGMSVEIISMFNKLLDYYSKYQNNYVKHNDKVKPAEIDFIIDLTSSFMKFLIKGHS